MTETLPRTKEPTATMSGAPLLPSAPLPLIWLLLRFHTPYRVVETPPPRPRRFFPFFIFLLFFCCPDFAFLAPPLAMIRMYVSVYLCFFRLCAFFFHNGVYLRVGTAEYKGFPFEGIQTRGVG